MDKDKDPNNFNLIRLFLASLVLVSHSYELVDGNRLREPLSRIFRTLSFGELAVDGFFVLSGFLIIGSYLARPEPIRFLTHRILRIFPGFIVCALICLLFVGRIGGSKDYFNLIDFADFLRHLPTLHLVGVPPVYPKSYYPVVNGSLWTLNLEFECYLLALVCGILGALKAQWPLLILWVIFCACYISAHLGVHVHILGRDGDVSSSICRLAMFFVAGGYLWVVDNHKRLQFEYILPGIFIVFLGLNSQVLAEPLLSFVGGYLLICFGRLQSTLLERLRALPDISYGTYLYGWPIQKILILKISDINPLGKV